MDLLDLYHVHEHALSLESEYEVHFNPKPVDERESPPRIVASGEQDDKQPGSTRKPKFVPWEPYKAAPSANRRGECPTTLPKLIAYPVSQKPVTAVDDQNNEVEGRLVDERRLRRSVEDSSHTTREMALEDEMSKLREELTLERRHSEELKRLMVATLSDELQGQVEALTADKVHLAHRVDQYVGKLVIEDEQLERLRIEADVWKCKFLAQSIRCDELNGRCDALLRMLLSAQRIVRDSNATTEEATTFATADLQPLFARSPCDSRVHRPRPNFANLTVACCKTCEGREIQLL